MVRPDRERGQLILIGALLVAATILASITLLNAVHESPEINTQQDSQSLVETDRTVDQTKANLEGSFLANTSVDEVGEKLPYANGSFDGLVEEYNNQSTNISTTEAAGLVNVTLNDAESATGAVAWQNESITGFEELPGDPSSTTILTGAERLPRLSMLVNSTDSSGSFTITVNGETLSVDDDSVELNGNDICDRNSEENAVELEFVNGTGAVITDEEYCGDIDLSAAASPTLTVVFENNNAADGTFVVSGENAGIGTFSPDDNRGTRDTAGPDTIFVDPAFDIEYFTPNVAYNATFSLYDTTG